MIRDLPPPAIPASVSALSTLTPDQRRLMNRALDERRKAFDPHENMVCIPFSSPGYHTRLTGGMVHPTRESLWYAAALLDTNSLADELAAFQIFEKVISLQDADPVSPTYGIWSWFLEESLSEMSPPDWNWADFCGALLIESLLTHRERIPAHLAGLMESSILHAAQSIKRRNVGPDYTNIAIMGSFVTLAAAETFGVDDLHQYGLNRLRRILEYTRSQGAFTEYNSPTYTIVALDELARMQRFVRDPEAGKITSYLYHMAWEEIALHFHAPTRQWAGPHSRCYHNFLPNTVKTVIRMATQGHPGKETEAETSLEMYRQRHECPDSLRSYFEPLRAPRTVRKTYLKQSPPIVGTTYLAPEFTLGSINYGDMWNQRRSLLAYWGTEEKPAYMRVQFLHDDYDFSGAWIVCRQEAGRVLAGVTFVTDGFDKHIFLDPIKDGTINARDLRLRFEIGGLPSDVRISAPESLKEPMRIEVGGISLYLSVPWARWGERASRWEVSRQGTVTCVDVILYSGEPCVFRLSELAEAAMAVALNITPKYEVEAPVRVLRTGDKCRLQWGDLALTLPARPGTINSLRAACSTEISSE